MHDSICRFVITPKAPDVIHIIHFVYETSMGAVCQNRLETACKLGLVASGEAVITCNGKKEHLQPGDLFFAFPAVPYILEGSADFTYLYISFLGLRANMLLDRLKISSDRYIFREFTALLPLWMDAVRAGDVMPELAAEGVLLLTLMQLANSAHTETAGEPDRTAQTMLLVKKTIDDGFVSPDLSVAALADQFGYHEKYISSTFKKYFKLGIKEYMTQLRINRACVLVEQGHSCVRDLAALCGYTDPMYFSKVFRLKMGMPPREYIRQQKKA